MNHYKKLLSETQVLLLVSTALSCFAGMGVWWLANGFFSQYIPPYLTAAAVVLMVLAFSFLVSRWLGNTILSPMKNVWLALMHVSSRQNSQAAPNIDRAKFGKTLAKSMALQIYSLAGGQQPQPAESQSDATQAVLWSVQTLPMPLIICDAKQNIYFANEAANRFFGDGNNLTGQPLNDVIRMKFQDKNTYETWLNGNRGHKVVDTQSWKRVTSSDLNRKVVRQFDLFAYFNEGISENFETTLLFYDKSQDYGQEDQGVDYVAMAVHELRTPLTIMRGYIEVLEDEVSKQVPPEYQEFIHKLSGSTQQLNSFVSNILNVARIDAEQLSLQIEECDWAETLKEACTDMELRAKIRGKHFEYQIEEGLPTVAIDKLSMYEVITNLLDNAIKYSVKSQKIIIGTRKSLDGRVETYIQDFGIGIPNSVLPQLFNKFYRSHRSRTQVGGTGLGLYLSKAIVEAQFGEIWVRSKEGEGSTFGFTLPPYSAVAGQLKNSDNKAQIERHRQGWIKNHSFVKR